PPCWKSSRSTKIILVDSKSASLWLSRRPRSRVTTPLPSASLRGSSTKAILPCSSSRGALTRSTRPEFRASRGAVATLSRGPADADSRLAANRYPRDVGIRRLPCLVCCPHSIANCSSGRKTRVCVAGGAHSLGSDARPAAAVAHTTLHQYARRIPPVHFPSQFYRAAREGGTESAGRLREHGPVKVAFVRTSHNGVTDGNGINLVLSTVFPFQR